MTNLFLLVIHKFAFIFGKPGSGFAFSHKKTASLYETKFCGTTWRNKYYVMFQNAGILYLRKAITKELVLKGQWDKIFTPVVEKMQTHLDLLFLF